MEAKSKEDLLNGKKHIAIEGSKFYAGGVCLSLMEVYARQKTSPLIAENQRLREALEGLLGSLNSYDENDQDAIDTARATLTKE